MTMEKLQGSLHSYDQVSKGMKTLHITPTFDTPGKHHVTILGTQTIMWKVWVLTSQMGT